MTKITVSGSFLKPCALFKGLGVGEKKCEINPFQNQVSQVWTIMYLLLEAEWSLCLGNPLSLANWLHLLGNIHWTKTILFSIVCISSDFFFDKANARHRLSSRVTALVVHLWTWVTLNTAPTPTGCLSSQLDGSRAESTPNNHTELTDNPQPKHQRITTGRWSIRHPARIHPEGKHKDEMRYHLTSLAQ